MKDFIIFEDIYMIAVQSFPLASGERFYPIYLFHKGIQIGTILMTAEGLLLKSFQLVNKNNDLKLCHSVVASKIMVFIPLSSLYATNIPERVHHIVKVLIVGDYHPAFSAC